MPPDSLEISSLTAAGLAMGLLILCDGIGRALIQPMISRTRSVLSLALTLPSGLIFVIGIAATIGLQRLNYLTLVPLLQIALRMRWRMSVLQSFEGRTSWQDWLVLIGVIGISILSMDYVQWAGEHGGHWLLPNRDLSYFALLAQEVPKAGVASQWAGTLGELTRNAGVQDDVWYHWGPVWLTALISKCTGLTAMEALLKVTSPALHSTMIIALSAMLATITGWAARRTLPITALALLAMSWPTMSLVTTMHRLLGGNLEPYIHWNATYQFSYKFEALLVFSSLTAWLSRRDQLAALLLFCAGISAPHNVGGLVIAAGALGGIAMLRRDKIMMRTSAVSVGLLMLGWLSVKVLFGVGLPKADQASLLVTEPALIVKNLGLLAKDLGIGALLVVLLLPGLWFLIRSPSINDERARALGWLGIAAFVSSYIAYEFLLPTGERGHFTNYAHAVLIFPLGFCGLVVASANATSTWIRHACASLMLVTIGIGTWDMVTDHSMSANGAADFSSNDLRRVRDVVRGERIGFFAKTDRHWWIPANSAITASIGSPCVRLNMIPAIDDAQTLGSFYGSQLPYQLVPKREGESSLDWSMRFAAALKIRFFMETPRDQLPDALRSRLKTEVEAPGLKIYSLK